MSDAMTAIHVLGSGSIAGSSGIIAALLSADPHTALLRNVDQISVFQAGNDAVLVLQIGGNQGTIHKGTRIGLFIPKTGPAWIAQADIIPLNAQVHTRIVFEDWTPSEAPAEAFALDPRALKLNTLDSTEQH